MYPQTCTEINQEALRMPVMSAQVYKEFSQFQSEKANLEKTNTDHIQASNATSRIKTAFSHHDENLCF